MFLTTWHELPEVPGDDIDWQALIALRSDVARELERLRVAGTIGAPLDAEVDIWCNSQQYRRLAQLRGELHFFLITSEARVHEISTAEAASASGLPPEAVAAASVDGGGVWIQVRVSEHAKCKRCWHHRPEVGQSATHPEICARCEDNLQLPGEQRKYS